MSTPEAKTTTPQPATAGRHRWRRRLAWGALALVVLFGLIQLVPYGHAKNPRHQGRRLAERAGTDAGRERLLRLPLQPHEAMVGNGDRPSLMAGTSRCERRPQRSQLLRVGQATGRGRRRHRNSAVRLHATDPVQALQQQRPPQRHRTPATRRRAHPTLRYRPASRHQTRRRLIDAVSHAAVGAGHGPETVG